MKLTSRPATATSKPIAVIGSSPKNFPDSPAIDPPTAALVEDAHPKELISYLRELGVDGYCLNDELVHRGSVEMLREEGFFVGVYTVNSAIRSHELFEMGVNFVFSDSLYKDKI